MPSSVSGPTIPVDYTTFQQPALLPAETPASQSLQQQSAGAETRRLHRSPSAPQLHALSLYSPPPPPQASPPFDAAGFFRRAPTRKETESMALGWARFAQNEAVKTSRYASPNNTSAIAKFSQQFNSVIDSYPDMAVDINAYSPQQLRMVMDVLQNRAKAGNLPALLHLGIDTTAEDALLKLKIVNQGVAGMRNAAPDALDKIDFRFAASHEKPGRPVPSLTGIDQLTELNILRGETLTEPPDLSNKPHLTYAQMDWMEHISHAPDFSGAPNLKSLSLAGMKLPDINGLSALPQLEHLIFRHSKIKVLPDLSQNKALAMLDVSETPLTTLPDLSQSANLRQLYLDTRLRDSLSELNPRVAVITSPRDYTMDEAIDHQDALKSAPVPQ